MTRGDSIVLTIGEFKLSNLMKEFFYVPQFMVTKSYTIASQSSNAVLTTFGRFALIDSSDSLISIRKAMVGLESPPDVYGVKVLTSESNMRTHRDYNV